MKSKIEEIILFDYEEMKECGKNEDDIENIYYELIDKLKHVFDFCKHSIGKELREYTSFFDGYPFIYIDTMAIYFGGFIEVKNTYGVSPIEVLQSYMNGGVTC